MSTTFARTFNDPERIKLAVNDKDRAVGPLESTYCAHGRIHSFRYEWPRGSGGPNNGELVILENPCVDCALAFELQPGRRRI